MNIYYAALFIAPLLVGCQEQPTGPSTPPAVETATANTSPVFSSIYVEMRTMAFSITPEMVGIDPESNDQTLALIVDWQLGVEGQATIVCMADGGMSMYLSSGGGLIGGIGHEDVRLKVEGIIARTDDIASAFSFCDEVPSIEANQMRLTRITRDAMYTAVALADDLESGQHPLSDLTNDVQSAIILLRSKKHEP